MRFSMFTVLDHYPGGPRSIAQYYNEVLDHARLAEELGLDSFWVAEHHFHEYGVSPNPAVLLGAIAKQTARIRLGPAISVLPFRNPLQVAEDYAMLDQLSGGRLVMGVGSGYLAHEFTAFGIAPEEKRERFDDALEILKRAWQGQKVSFDGRFHKIDEVALNVLPRQRPMPPIYLGILRAEACYHVGRQGNRIILVPYASVERMEEIGSLVGAHQEGLAEAGADFADDAALVTLHTHVAESDAEARTNAAGCFDLYVETRLYAKRQVYDDILRSRLGIFGSVERATEQLVELAGLGVRHVVLLLDFGAMPAEAVRRSLRLITAEVIPAVEARLAKD